MENPNVNNRNRASSSSDQEGAVLIKDLLSLCLRNWYWFLISVFLVGLATTMYVLRIEPQYTRTAMVQIKDDAQGRSINGSVESFTDLGFIQTKSKVIDEIGILQSPALMQEVVRHLGLDVSCKVDGRFHKRVLYGANQLLTVRFIDLNENTPAAMTINVAEDGNTYTLSDLLLRSEEASADPNEHAFSDTIATSLGRIVVEKTPFYKSSYSRFYITKSTVEGTARRFSNHISVALNDKQSNLVNITCQDVSIQRANDVINALVDVYNDNWIKDKNQIAISTSRFINERLSIIEEELGGVDEDISNYKSERLVPDINSASNMYLNQKTQTENEILELNNQLYMARYVKEYMTTPENEMQLLPPNSGVGNGSIESQIAEYNEKLLRRRELVANSSESNPLVVEIDNALMAIRTSIITSIDNRIIILNQQLDRLRQVEARATQQLASSPMQNQYLSSVQRQQKVKEALYLFLLQKREENQLSQAFTAYNTRIITPPMGSPTPTSPKKKQFYLIAFLLGLAIPVAVIYLKEISNTKLRGKADLKNLSVPFIGEIPTYGSSKRLKKGEFGAHPVVVKEGRRDIINEAFRVVRTNLDFMVGNDPNQKVFVFTSFNPGSGKSFISVNTAICFALKGKKILVIDGDMRHGSASCYVQAPKVGISDYLSGRIEDVDQVLVNAMNYDNLFVLPVGTTPPNPTELLMQERFGKMILHFREEFDYIFIDCPPLDIVADAQIISQHADRMVFIMRAGLFERSLISEVNALYEEKKYKNMSVILNGTESSDSKYGYKYGYRYGYKYGYSYSHSYYGNDNAQDHDNWKEIV